MIDTTNATTIQETCRAYREGRRSNYAFRCRRYDAVIDLLIEMGMSDSGDWLLDFGSGDCEFIRRVNESGYELNYTGIDGADDGVDLNVWLPSGFVYDWIIAIEVLEHLHDPGNQLFDLSDLALKGVVITTPNPRTVDVLACDPTHVSIVTPEMLENAGYGWEEVSLFGKPKDSLIGWKKK